MNATAIGAIGALAGAVVGLIGVLIGQYLTQRRHSEALRKTAELEEQRANREALLKYFEYVGQLGSLVVTDPSKADSLSPILRAQTYALLEGLEPDHKRILLQFLYELSLIGPEKPGLSLQGTNLERAHLVRTNLAEAYLVRANLGEANLVDANLRKANLKEAHLVDANLRKANLKEANLVDVNLRRANLAEANLKEADLSGAFLQEITKESLTQTQINEAIGNDATKLPDHLQRPAHWRGGLEGRVLEGS